MSFELPLTKKLNCTHLLMRITHGAMMSIAPIASYRRNHQLVTIGKAATYSWKKCRTGICDRTSARYGAYFLPLELGEEKRDDW